MQTEIIKLNSKKQSIVGLFQNLKEKVKSNKNYDITVIVKECEDNTKEFAEQNQAQIQIDQNKSRVDINEDSIIHNIDLSHSSLEFDAKMESEVYSDSRIEENRLRKLVNKLNIKRRENTSMGEQIQRQQKVKQKQMSLMINVTDSIVDKNRLTVQEDKLEEQEAQQSHRYSFQINNQEIKETGSSKSNISEGDDDSEAGFLIQNYLNQAMGFVQKNKFNELQDFLYGFKQKYTFVNVRSQAKWSLLMAHCKQGKLEYERAATNYNQVIQILKEHPTIIMVELGDIYNHLGLCYFQMREWNKGITAYSQALNLYKKGKKCLQYANCISNLGVLYLQVNYFIEAQKCLLMAYSIKQRQYDKKHRDQLLSILFLLFDCNLKVRNQNQCENILRNAGEIIDNLKEVDVRHRISFEIKKSRLCFMRDKFHEAFSHCQTVFDLLSNNKVESLQLAEIFQMMGMIKQDMHQLQKSKSFFQKALKSIQKYVPVDSIQIQILRKKVETLNQKIRRYMSNKKNSVSISHFANSLSDY